VPRSLTILMPNGRTEYWFTERVFDVGDKLERDGVTWIVTSIGETAGATKHMSVTVRRDGDSPS
jgi:hypothetical protein